jgi:hypothetical protein
MKNKFPIYFGIIVLLLIAVGMGGYYWSIKTTKPTQTIPAKVNPKTIEEVLADQVYKGKSFRDATMTYSEEVFEYHLRGITDGVAIEEPFEIKTGSGELLATNELAYRIFYLDAQQKLQSMMVALVVKLPDGSVLPMSDLDSMKESYGDAPTLEQMKSYFKKYFENMPGKIMLTGFYATPEDIDSLFKKAEDLGRPEPPGSYVSQVFQLAKKQVAGRLGEYHKLVESGDPGLGIILLHQGTSAFYEEGGTYVNMGNLTLPKVTPL